MYLPGQNRPGKPSGGSGVGSLRGLEHLDTIVGGVGDVDPAGGLVDANSMQVAELAVAGSLAAEGGQELAVLVEHLHPVVADFGDVDAILSVDRDAGRCLEFTIGRTGLAPNLGDFALAVELCAFRVVHLARLGA